jgi:hypothetical protein
MAIPAVLIGKSALRLNWGNQAKCECGRGKFVCVDVGRHPSGSHSLGALSGWLGRNHGTCTVSGILVSWFNNKLS